MTTLLHTTKGVSPMHEIVEKEMDQAEAMVRPEPQHPESRVLYWEAVRHLVNTVGARDALDIALLTPEGRLPQ